MKRCGLRWKRCGRGKRCLILVCVVGEILMASRVEARLKEREQARRTALEHHRKEREKDNVEQESVRYFFSKFLQQKRMIDGERRI